MDEKISQKPYFSALKDSKSEEENTFGLYIHIPFCRSRCAYCGFYSTTLTSLRSRYIDALCREMELRCGYLKGKTATIYLGGGTPSQLCAADIKRLFSYIYNVYDVKPDAEVTMECNPDDVTEEFVAMLKDAPVNRVSMGAQTFNDARLAFLRRRHTATEVDEAVKRLRKVGIRNISLDLMFGFPNETINEWNSDISHALALQPEHLSAYSLMYEADTPLWRMLQRGEVAEISDELSLAMYEELINRMDAAGYEHYEISNFARPSMRSHHNSSYWNRTPYIGIGAAAHSFDVASRQWNVADIRRYIDGIDRGIVPMEREELDGDTRFNDIITTALRTSDGISLCSLKETLGSRYEDILLKNAMPQISSGFMKLQADHLSLTRKGLFISNTIMSDMMIV